MSSSTDIGPGENDVGHSHDGPGAATCMITVHWSGVGKDILRLDKIDSRQNVLVCGFTQGSLTHSHQIFNESVSPFPPASSSNPRTTPLSLRMSLLGSTRNKHLAGSSLAVSKQLYQFEDRTCQKQISEWSSSRIISMRRSLSQT